MKKHGFEICLITFFAVAIVLCVIAIGTQSQAERAACFRSGGHMVVDHYETSGTVVNGNGTVMTFPVYRCQKK